jgi:hypothetical protein
MFCCSHESWMVDVGAAPPRGCVCAPRRRPQEPSQVVALWCRAADRHGLGGNVVLLVRRYGRLGQCILEGMVRLLCRGSSPGWIGVMAVVCVRLSCVAWATFVGSSDSMSGRRPRNMVALLRRAWRSSGMSGRRLRVFINFEGARPCVVWVLGAELMKENLCATLSGTPSGRYDEHSRKFSLSKKPRFIDQ